MTFTLSGALAPTMPKRRKATPEEMAVRIKEIARLRATGHRNAEIAAALGVSKKTIEMTVYKYEITKNGKILDPKGTCHARPPWRPTN